MSLLFILCRLYLCIMSRLFYYLSSIYLSMHYVENLSWQETYLKRRHLRLAANQGTEIEIDLLALVSVA